MNDHLTPLRYWYLSRLREERLTALLNSKSWRLTKLLREIKVHFRRPTMRIESIEAAVYEIVHKDPGVACAVTEAGKCLKNGDLPTDTEYLRHLRQQIMGVVSSRSWKLTQPWRIACDKKSAHGAGLVPGIDFPLSGNAAAGASVLGTAGLREPVPPSVAEPIDRYQAWVSVNQWNSRSELHLKRELAGLQARLPAISVVMPVYDPPLPILQKAVESVRNQHYERWQLCIADDAGTDAAVRQYLNSLGSDSRIEVAFRPENGHISEATNTAARLARGEYLLFLDQDDELSVDALAEVALYIARRPETDLLYSDSDKIDMDGRRFEPHFKPDWSPETLLSYMYACQVLVVRRELFESAGGMRRGYEGAQDHDLALRVSEVARHVGHISKVLYHWRAIPGSQAVSGHSKPYASDAGRRAVQDALLRRGSPGTSFLHDWARLESPGNYAIRFPDDGPSVAVIIRACDETDLLSRCLSSLAKTRYKNYRLVVVGSDGDADLLSSLKDFPCEVARVEGRSASPSYLMNRAAELVNSDYLLFLDSSSELLSAEWLSTMVGYAQLDNVGAVGALIYYPDGTVRHAGLIHGLNGGLCGSAYDGLPPGQWGNAHHIGIARNYSAVSGACLLTNRQLFIEAGGFDGETFPDPYNDSDYCHRLSDLGYRSVFCPDAKFVNHGRRLDSRDGSSAGAAYRARYRQRHEPYYNPNLTRHSELLLAEPKRVSTDPLTPIKVLVYAPVLDSGSGSQLAVVRYLKEQGVIDPAVIARADGPERLEYERSGIPVRVMTPVLMDSWAERDCRQWMNALKASIADWGVELVFADSASAFDAICVSHELGLPSVWSIRECNVRQQLRLLSPALIENVANCLGYPYRVVFGSSTIRQQYQMFEVRHNFADMPDHLNTGEFFSELFAEAYFSCAPCLKTAS